MTKKASTNGLLPGKRAEKSGQYGVIGTSREVTVTKGEPLPPTQKKGERYRLVDATKHRKGGK